MVFHLNGEEASEFEDVISYIANRIYPPGLSREEKSVFQHKIAPYSLIRGILFKMGADEQLCRAPLLEECPQHHGHKGDPGVTPGTCGAIGERTQVILVWVRAPKHWERLPPMETRSHEGKALSIGWLMAL